MFLSNPRRTLLLLAFFAVFLHGCGASTTTSTRKPSSGNTTGGRPFPTKEPDAYQGEFVISDGTTEEHYFVARKQDQWRFDVTNGGVPTLTQLRSDKIYMIDHAKKSYAVEAYADLKDFDTAYFNSLSLQFFRGANYIDYEELARDGSLVKYRAKTLKDSKNDVIVTVDESNGMMVRQEIMSQKNRTAEGTPVNYVFEVRNLKLDVDDSVFEIPAGYRRVAQLADLPKPTVKQ
jgi:hypothetical protein